jgi:succinate dehydrogenase / fumarate reductase flavoprotein subunit
LGVYLDFAEAMKTVGVPVINERYGNLFEMDERITAENPSDANLSGRALHDGWLVG